MKNTSFTIAALALCVLSFGASAATPVPPSGNQDHTQVGIAQATDIEAGSNIAPGSRTTGQSMSDAFNVHYAGGRRVVIIYQTFISPYVN